MIAALPLEVPSGVAGGVKASWLGDKTSDDSGSHKSYKNASHGDAQKKNKIKLHSDSFFILR